MRSGLLQESAEGSGFPRRIPQGGRTDSTLRSSKMPRVWTQGGGGWSQTTIYAHSVACRSDFISSEARFLWHIWFVSRNWSSSQRHSGKAAGQACRKRGTDACYP